MPDVSGVLNPGSIADQIEAEKHSSDHHPRKNGLGDSVPEGPKQEQQSENKARKNGDRKAGQSLCEGRQNNQRHQCRQEDVEFTRTRFFFLLVLVHEMPELKCVG